MTTDISVGVRYDFITRLLYYILPLLSIRFITLYTEVYICQSYHHDLHARWDPLNGQQDGNGVPDEFDFEYDGGNSSSRLFERSRIRALAGNCSSISSLNIFAMPNLLNVLSPLGPHQIRSGVFLSCGVEQFNESIPTASSCQSAKVHDKGKRTPLWTS